MLEELLGYARTADEQKLLQQLAGRVRSAQRPDLAQVVGRLTAPRTALPEPPLNAASSGDALFAALSQIIVELNALQRTLRRPSRIVFLRNNDGLITAALPEYSDG